MKKILILSWLMLICLASSVYGEAMNPTSFVLGGKYSSKAEELHNVSIVTDMNKPFIQADTIKLLNNGNVVYTANRILNHTVSKYYEVPIFKKNADCLQTNGSNPVEIQIYQNGKCVSVLKGILELRSGPFLTITGYNPEKKTLRCQLLNCPIGQDAKLIIYNDFVSEKLIIGEVRYASGKYNTLTAETEWVGKISMSPGQELTERNPAELIYQGQLTEVENMNTNNPAVIAIQPLNRDYRKVQAKLTGKTLTVTAVVQNVKRVDQACIKIRTLDFSTTKTLNAVSVSPLNDFESTVTFSGKMSNGFSYMDLVSGNYMIGIDYPQTMMMGRTIERYDLSITDKITVLESKQPNTSQIPVVGNKK